MIHKNDGLTTMKEEIDIWDHRPDLIFAEKVEIPRNKKNVWNSSIHLLSQFNQILKISVSAVDSTLISLIFFEAKPPFKEIKNSKNKYQRLTIPMETYTGAMIVVPQYEDIIRRYATTPLELNRKIS